MRIEQVENMTVGELQSFAANARLDTELADTHPGELADRYVKALISAKIRDVKLAEQADTLASLKEGMEAIKRVALAGAKSDGTIIKELTAAGIASRNAVNSYDALIEKIKADAAIELGETKEITMRAHDRIKVLIAAASQRDEQITKLTVQANTYAEAIGQAQALMLGAMNAKAVADASADVA
jgi:hypothetical protein